MKRDLIGYGAQAPDLYWPNNARVAVNFVLNYEEGAELSPYYHDAYAESYGGEFPMAAKPKGVRNLSMESLFEYGSRSGIWRMLRLFEEEKILLTLFVCGMALEQNPLLTIYLKQSQHEIAGHGWRWLDCTRMSVKQEQQHINKCVTTLEALTNKKIMGWYTGRRSERTVDLLIKSGQFLYLSDSYADDLPYLIDKQLIIPYTLDCNDFRYTTQPGFNTGEDFFNHLTDTLEYLVGENRPAIMTIALHARISGRPGRTMAIKKFIARLKKTPNIWIATRAEIARHWLEHQP